MLGVGGDSVSKPWGQPVLSIRLPAEDIRGLKHLALRRELTVTEIVRDLIEQLLDEEGIPRKPEQLPGQMSISE